ncbi:uncharacterized protein RVIR1_04330 [Candidatus Rickettsiella viridis]|uniref:Uncharacterized protein n=1 Tax=Candidatus Rickettsiella viridis TaxID=676208 RepID=A0A2Z5UTK9_9COXI|nr:hypothetical protein [Candidatus Rickettsiella viridis]BBB14946.1 uncharacterized protein RVIR1_04330 [Candidatus Rickettsiella viridis]
MLPIIKLRGHLHTSSGKYASAVSIISLDQSHQQGIEFEAFCLAINEQHEKGNISKLTIIETGYLKRHYLRLDKNYCITSEADAAAIQLGKNWVKEQLSSLHLLKMPVEILSWQEIIDSDFLSKVKNDSISDNIFIGHIKTLAEKYAEKLEVKYNPNGLASMKEACLKAARAYLVEESSIIAGLKRRGFDFQLYPGNRNAALRYIAKKYFSGTQSIPWIRYDIKYPSLELKEKKLNPSASLFFEKADASTQETKNKIVELLSSLLNEEKFYFLTEQLNKLEQSARIANERDIK